LPSAQFVADRVFSALDRFLHVEAMGGVVLLVAATAALLWANSPAADSYHDFWDATLTIGVGGLLSEQTLHFWINDGLMTIFFLVVGMEVRREMHEGALAEVRLAALPLAAAIGGVAVPALLYLAVNTSPALRAGWAVPTATDIAFAVGVLALLGRSIPGSVRVFLLALAVIDDIAAVMVIAAFYSSGGLQYSGFLLAAAGVLLVLGFQRIGIGAAYAYVLPGAIVWFGLLHGGIHPTLAGVVLGLMTPVASQRAGERPIDAASKALTALGRRRHTMDHDPRALLEPLRQLRYAQREILPPVVRVQMALHPWVAYGVMPLFALANAGVSVSGADAPTVSSSVMLGVVLALLVGKPVGIVLAAWIAVRLRWCVLPPGLTWPGVLLVGCLGGIGFTMSIFIATLAFADESLLAAAKSGVLLASAGAGVLGLTLGGLWLRRAPQSRRDCS
jgi:NhaA family Na+:H+ antiporter